MSDSKEIPVDLKDDIKQAFDLYKNENNKINKLKLRTMLFSFVMYKSSSSDINDYIDSKLSNDKELYSFDDVCDLINDKFEEAKENDADELYDYIVNNKTDDSKITKKQISNAFKSCNIDVDVKEIDKMIEYIKKKKNKEGEKERENEQMREQMREKDMQISALQAKNDELSDIIVEQEQQKKQIDKDMKQLKASYDKNKTPIAKDCLIQTIEKEKKPKEINIK